MQIVLNSLNRKCRFGMVLISVVWSARSTQHHIVAHSKTFNETTSRRGVFCWQHQSHQAKEVATQCGWLLPCSTYHRFAVCRKILQQGRHQLLTKGEEDGAEEMALLTYLAGKEEPIRCGCSGCSEVAILG